MKINDLIKNLNADIINIADVDREIVGGYCGDFLSVVMGKAPESAGWFTIMNNQNVAAVATLTDVGVIILCDGVKPDPLLDKKVRDVDINCITTSLSVFDAVKKSGLSADYNYGKISLRFTYSQRAVALCRRRYDTRQRRRYL